MSVFFQPIEPYGIQSGFLDRFVDFPFPQYLRSHDIREIELRRRDRRLRVGRENASPPPILRNRVPFGTLRSHTLEQSGKMGVCFFPSGMRGEASGRGAARARHFRTHPPPSTGHYGFFSRHPPVRWRQRPAQVRAAPALRREHRFDATAAADVPRVAKFRMIRPPRERRARARRDVPVGSDDPGLTSTPPAASPGPPPRARTSRPRATSRCVPSSYAFLEIFGDARGLGKKTRSRRRAGCGARSGRTRVRAAARAPGRRPGEYARALVAFPARSDARRPRVPPSTTASRGSNAPPSVDAPPRQVDGALLFEPRTRQLDVLPLWWFFLFGSVFFSLVVHVVDRKAHLKSPRYYVTLNRLAPRAMRPTPPRRRGP